MFDLKHKFAIYFTFIATLSWILLSGCSYFQQPSDTTINHAPNNHLHIILNEIDSVNCDRPFSISNNSQIGSSVVLTSNGGKLFSVDTLLSTRDTYYLCSIGDYLYYSIVEETDDGDWFFFDHVYCYHIPSGEITFLFTAPSISRSSIYFDEFGKVYFPTEIAYDPNTPYYIIWGNQIVDQTCTSYGYTFGDRTYFIVDQDTEETLYCRIGNDAWAVDQRLRGGKNLLCLATSEGLVIHKRGSDDMLYFVNGTTGEVIELLSTTALSTQTAVNVYNNYVFVSYLRYEKIEKSGKGLAPYENDNLSGTYRINLTDNSIIKISDTIYDGLYIFCENIIYATDSNGTVSKLSFDGHGGEWGRADGSPVP